MSTTGVGARDRECGTGGCDDGGIRDGKVKRATSMGLARMRG